MNKMRKAVYRLRLKQQKLLNFYFNKRNDVFALRLKQQKLQD